MPPFTIDYLTYEDIFTLDQCSRKFLYSPFEPPRLSMATVMYEALLVGLQKGPSAGNHHVIERAANPGLALSGCDVYTAAMHHAYLIETVTTYLLKVSGQAKWERPAPINIATGGMPILYQPLSFIIDGRLRRIILCSRWDANRALEEQYSWRSLADICATNLPMTITAVVIGAIAPTGHRPSAWTRAHQHPIGKQLRVKLRPDKEGYDRKFKKAWRTVYRERTKQTPEDWLGLMQQDMVFDDLIHTVNIDSQPDDATVGQFKSFLNRARQPIVDEMRRSSCFGLQPCIYSRLCHASPALAPSTVGWKTKEKGTLY
jgi:hypothetical protein